MSLKTADNVLSVFEVVIYVLTFAGWAALGFPYLKTVGMCGLLIIIGIFAYRWIVSRHP
jgi:hypothetical protein